MSVILMNQKMPNKIKTHHGNPGSKYRQLWDYEYDPNLHCMRRKPGDKLDVQKYIQESADDVDFANIGKMLVDTRDNVAGHFTAAGETFDLTKTPRNIHEYQNLYLKIKDTFDKLPDDVKVLFNNDVKVFRSAYEKGNIQKILSKPNDNGEQTGFPPKEKEKEGDK